MSSLHGGRQNAFSYVCARFTSFNPVRTRSVLLDPHGNYQNRLIQWGRLMLLAEQKAGLFDSVDQRARPVFIIWASADVREGWAAVSRFRKIKSALESFWGWKPNYVKLCPLGKDFFQLCWIVIQMAQAVNSSWRGCEIKDSQLYDIWASKTIFILASRYDICFCELAPPWRSSSLLGFTDTASKTFCALSGSVYDHALEKKFSHKS